MATFLTLAQAKGHINSTAPEGDPRDADLLLKLEQAEAIVIDYLKRKPTDPVWTAENLPKPVQASMLLVFARLVAHRGDLESADDELWGALERLLRRFRDPAVAY